MLVGEVGEEEQGRVRGDRERQREEEIRKRVGRRKGGGWKKSIVLERRTRLGGGWREA
jgi:hypothetical protein